MDDNKYHGVKDVNWQDLNSGEAKIKFINRKRKTILKKMVKLFFFILIAAVSGGVSGAYVTSRNSSANKIYTPNNQTLMEAKKETSEVRSKVESSNTGEENSGGNTISRVAELVGPTVVGISNKSQGYFGLQDTGSGSGIIIDSKGYIVTNYHVIQNADKITVKLSSGKILEASLVGSDPKSDLAVIKVNAKNLPQAKFGDSSKIQVGDTAIAIGNPLGENFAGSVTSGIISALNRKVEYNGSIYKVIQTDAAINPGNSGGALCNINGDVIGINSFKMGSEENTEGIGFAISINEVKGIIKQLMSTGEVERPYLGITYGESVSSENNKIQGIYIQEVARKSGASRAGIRPTDILIELDGRKVLQLADVDDIVSSHKVGDSVNCKLLREGKIIEVNAVLSKANSDK